MSDLLLVQRQIDECEKDLAEEIRHGEVNPSQFVALRCERLYRTIEALKKRKRELFKNVKRYQPHTVPRQSYGGNSYYGGLSRRAGYSDAENELDYANYGEQVGALPSSSRYGYKTRRKVERWVDIASNGSENGDGEWEWQGRALRVVKNVIENDSDALDRLLKKTLELEKRLDGLEASAKSKKPNLSEIEKNWSEETKVKVEAGEELGERNIRAREAAREELRKRAVVLRQELDHNSALAIQSVFRGKLGRKKMREARKAYNEKIQHQGAELIQSRFRGHMARKQIAGKVHERDQHIKESAACVIQSQFRGTVARKNFTNAKTIKEKRLAACQMIQAWWRGVTSRISVQSLRNEYMSQLDEAAAVMLQCAWRCFKARKKKDKLLELKVHAMEEAAAIMLQAAWRGYQARHKKEELKRKLDQVREDQRVMDHAERVKTTFYAKYWLNKEQKAAVMIQALGRDFLERKRRLKRLELKKQQDAAAEDSKIDRLLEEERKKYHELSVPSPQNYEEEQDKNQKVVFDSEIDIPLEWADQPQEMVSVRFVVREFKNPFELRFEATEPLTETPFYCKIDIDALESLLLPLFMVNENQQTQNILQQKIDSKPIFDWIRNGKPPKRKHIISFILNRMWIDQKEPDGELELCLGTDATAQGVHGFDKSLTAAIPPSSPYKKKKKNIPQSPSYNNINSPYQSRTPPTQKKKNYESGDFYASGTPDLLNSTAKRTRDAFAVRYVNK